MECCDDYLWLLIIGFIISFVLAFGIGANDVANTFGTSVGAKVLTLRQACLLATIFETLGSILIGAKVSGTIRKGILDPKVFEGNELELMLGYISALLGCCVWLIIATVLGLPVSGTHSIVGSTLGMAIVSKGFMVIKWLQIAKIASSWVISPLLSGLVSVLMFLTIKKLILLRKHPLKSGLALLPIIYTITIFINIGGVVQSSPPLLRLDLIPWWGRIILLLILSITVYIVVQFLLVPYLRKKIKKSKPIEMELQGMNKNNESTIILENKANALSISNENHPLNKHIRRQKLSQSMSVDNENTVNLTLEGYLHTFGPLTSKTRKSVKTESFIVKPLADEVQAKDELVERAILAVPESDSSNQNTITSQNKSIGRFVASPVDKDPIPTKFRELFYTPENEENENLNNAVNGKELNKSDVEESKKTDLDISRFDPPETYKLFSFLQILTAIFGSFAHGGNDVSNAIGPLIGLYLVYKDGIVASTSRTPEWILLYGGLGISIGLWILGRKVIKTIGEDLTKITPSSGFVIELSSAMTVLAASLLNIPVSSTHCKVGAVVFTGRVRSKESVDWSLFKNIIIAWAVTVPITGCIAALCQFGLKYAFGLL